FIRDVPHFAEGAVDQLASKLRVHEQDAVVDRVKNGVKLLVSGIEVSKCRFGDITSPRCILLAALQIGNIEIGQHTAAIRQRSRLKLDDPPIPQAHFGYGSRTLAYRLETLLNIFLELIRRNVIEVLTPDMN